MRRLFFVLLLFTFFPPAWAQHFEFDSARMPLAELSGDARFHTGDDPGWAAPSFDDRDWPLIKLDRRWSEQGYKNYGGTAWYRFNVTFLAGNREMALLIPYLNDSYAVFADGRLLGQIGEFPPHAKVVSTSNEIFSIPGETITAGRPVAIAIRVWRWPLVANYGGGGFGTPPIIGEAQSVARYRDLQIHDLFWRTEIIHVMIAANLLSAIVGLILFAARPKEREYMWFGMAQVAWSLYSIVDLAFTFLRLPTVSSLVTISITSCVASLLNLVFFHALLHERRRALFHMGAWPLLLSIPLSFAPFLGWITFTQFDAIRTGFLLPYTLAVAALLVRASLRGSVEARLLVGPFSLSCSIWLFNAALGVLDLSHHPMIAAMQRWLQHVITWPFHVNYGNLVGLLCIGSVCGVLILRFAQSRRDEERLSAELEAARVVQEVMIPNEVPSVPGFRIESVYRPAGQVGGDFFQIVPLAGGGALIAIGDVSGKGMPAAMTVSLLVGTFRTLAHFTESPSAILAAMNQRMLGRSQGGFTTCLAIRLAADGMITLANAGHISPYLDGREVGTENGLPLGISAAAEYAETTLELDGSSRLTLVTDGVVEARNADGELMGFDRTRELSKQAADQIADAAQAFGQEDDITVLTLHPAPSAVLA